MAEFEERVRGIEKILMDGKQSDLSSKCVIPRVRKWR